MNQIDLVQYSACSHYHIAPTPLPYPIHTHPCVEGSIHSLKAKRYIFFNESRSMHCNALKTTHMMEK